MKRALILRSLLDSWLLLVGCCVLATAFTALRVWVASQIQIHHFIKFFSEGLKFLQGLLPVPVEELASPLGRVAFSFEEFALVLILGMWTVTRGSDCLAGRIGAGTMEMLLAQPVRRLTLVATHSLVTLLGVVAIAAASWLGVAVGLALSKFEEPPRLVQIAPAALSFLCLGLFFTGAVTLVSAVCRSRAQAVSLVLGFYVVQLAFMIVERLSQTLDWMRWLTILTAYEPTLLTLGVNRAPGDYWPLFWQYNSVLVGLAALLLAASTAIFCRRDVPAPL